jgi:hypothetical protein
VHGSPHKDLTQRLIFNNGLILEAIDYNPNTEISVTKDNENITNLP